MTIHGPLAARGQVGRALATAAGGATVGLWYDPNGAFAADGGNLYAWRAQNSVGTVWPGGPANYAASLVAQSGGVNLVEGNGAVPWAAATGWDFVAAAAQLLDTGLMPANDQSWSMFIQYTNDLLNNNTLCGSYTAVDRAFMLKNSAAQVRYFNGNALAVVPALASGNIGVAGNLAYRNGGLDGGPIAAWGGVATRNIYIGNAHGLVQYVTAKIQTLWIYDQNPALVQAQAVLAGGFRAAMGQL